MTSRGAGTLARFATQSGHLASSVVKPKLFEPNRELKLSVFHVEGLISREISIIGESVVKAHPQARRLYGWGEVGESEVLTAGLKIDYDDFPPRHANIIDWPQDKAQRLQIQQILASSATAHRLNSPAQVC